MMGWIYQIIITLLLLISTTIADDFDDWTDPPENFQDETKLAQYAVEYTKEYVKVYY